MQKQKNIPRLSPSKKDRFKVTNWPEYNRSLIERGKPEHWLNASVFNTWYHIGYQGKGGQLEYSDACIEVCLTIKLVFGLGYRQTQGFIECYFKEQGITLKVPSYSVLCKRSDKIEITWKTTTVKGTTPISLAGDSTGLRVFGEGEWKVRKHGWGKHRTWQKLHLVVEPKGKHIYGAELTTNAIDDAAVIDSLLDQVRVKVTKFMGDGAYDRMKVYDSLRARKIVPVIPPRKDARIILHGNRKHRKHQRDKNLRQIRKMGRKKWKAKSKYHIRSIAETTMFRYKKIIGSNLKSRVFEKQITETRIGCKILNKFTALGMPRSVKTKT